MFNYYIVYYGFFCKETKVNSICAHGRSYWFKIDHLGWGLVGVELEECGLCLYLSPPSVSIIFVALNTHIFVLLVIIHFLTTFVAPLFVV